MVVSVALGSALFYALASVLQHRSASEAPDEARLRPSLLLRLVMEPLWIAGVLCDVAGLVCQVWALAHGPMLLVQPLLVTGLLFALPMGALASRRRIPRSDLFGAVAVVCGLGLFLSIARPGPGRPAGTLPWIWAATCTTAVTVALVALASHRGRSTGARSAFLAASAGLSMGFAAALVEATSHSFRARGLVHLLVGWQLYALLITGFVALLLTQSAFQSGPLADSLPVLTVVDPLVSIALGALLLHETLSDSPIAIALEVLGLGVMAAGVMIDGRSVLMLPARKRPAAGIST